MVSDEEQQRQALECLDHKFFEEMLIEIEVLYSKVKEEKFEVRGAKGT